MIALKCPHKLVLLIKRYLSNRKQCVRIGNSISPLVSVGSGIPQGCILGLYCSRSSLMILLICLLEVYVVPLRMIKILCHSQEDLHYNLGLLSNWVTINNIDININKSGVMVMFSSDYSFSTPSMLGAVIPKVTQ